jgi:predicted lipid-binding transport protein (Tim44 family)
LQLVELLILAALAAVVLYQLYAVLGRRVGRQPEEGPPPAPSLRQPDGENRGRDSDLADSSGANALLARDPNFDPSKFLQGAITAYQTIVRAYASGDRDALRPLVSPVVMTSFEKALDAREAEGRSESVEFLHPPRADIDKAEADGDVARVRVRFLSEFRSRTKGPEGEAVDDRRTAELWTFERKIGSRDPNWTMTRVEEANA